MQRRSEERVYANDEAIVTGLTNEPTRLAQSVTHKNRRGIIYRESRVGCWSHV